jgi:murein DD-endopeptidase MepM/ murein hydrolase activator NlpD
VFRFALGATLMGLSASLIILATPRSTTPADDIAPPVIVEAPPPSIAVPPAPSAAVRDTPSAVTPAAPKAPIAIDLRRRDLMVPVEGVTRAALVNSFRDRRNGNRQHEAIDILAPRGTPVLAVEGGTIEKLFTSVRGGLTIYQFDRTRTYTYYYAHLDRYQVGLREGQRVERGQVIGFVGTTGNAPKTTPHLHFAILLLSDKKQWWDGEAINPYDVWQP